MFLPFGRVDMARYPSSLLRYAYTDTGIELKALIEAVAFLEKTLKRPLPGRMYRVLSHQQSCEVA